MDHKLIHGFPKEAVFINFRMMELKKEQSKKDWNEAYNSLNRGVYQLVNLCSNLF